MSRRKRSSWSMPAALVRGSIVPFIVTVSSAAATVATGCKKPSPPPEPVQRTTLADAESTLRPVAAPSASHAAASDARAPLSHPAPGPTVEAILEEARTNVSEAGHLATGKDPCAAILPLLDGAYALVRSTSPFDERTLGVFAECAMKAERWRLLRDVAEAIAAGERKLETTYFLPRALVGLADYEPAHGLAKATLRAWPTEGEAYDTAALAALRVKDWDGAMKAADQALLLQRKHTVNDAVTAFAHGLRGAAVLHMGKIEDGVHEIDAVAARKGHEDVLRVAGVTADAARAAKQTGLLATIDVPRQVYPALLPLYEKKVAPLSGMVTVVLQNLNDKPLPVKVEVALTGAEGAAESETVVKGRPITVILTPTWKPSSALASPKAPEPHDLTVTITGGADHGTILHETHKVTFQPGTELPKVLRAHGDDLRSAFALEAAWVTKAAPSVALLMEAAKARLKSPTKQFDGAASHSLPQVQALWDELRSKSVSFHRDPTLDSEATESEPCRLPAEVVAAGAGNALESSVLLASLLEAIGLDVVLVRTPGHRFVGWMATAQDLAATETTPGPVKSPKGLAFFLETTTVGDGPLDAAVLRGDAEWVAATNDGSVASGRAQLESLPELRRRGLLARAE